MLKTKGSHRLRLILNGPASEGGHVLVSDFLAEVKLLYSSLRSVDRSLSAAGTISTDYRVTDLTHSSPATVELEAVAKATDYDRSREVVGTFMNLLEDVRRGSLPDSGVSLPTLLNLQKMTKPVGRTIQSLQIQQNGTSINLDRDFTENLVFALSLDEEYEGAVRGVVEAINLHDGANAFRVYPDVGPRKVSCTFPKVLEAEAVASVGRFVRVHGLLKRKKVARFPHEMRVDHLTILPTDDELPSLVELRGIAPGITGRLTSSDFVRALRDDKT